MNDVEAIPLRRANGSITIVISQVHSFHMIGGNPPETCAPST